jgi:hypothetical protein
VCSKSRSSVFVAVHGESFPRFAIFQIILVEANGPPARPRNDWNKSSSITKIGKHRTGLEVFFRKNQKTRKLALSSQAICLSPGSRERTLYRSGYSLKRAQTHA